VVSHARPFVSYELVARSCSAEPVSPATWPTPTRKLLVRLGTPSSEDRAGDGLPVALVLVYGRVNGTFSLFLQERSRANARDEYGKLSLISSRLTVTDLRVALNGLLDPGVIELSPVAGAPLDDTRATDKVLEHLEGAFPLPGPAAKKYPIPLDAFREAAVRETYATFGLSIPRDRFKHHPIPAPFTSLDKAEGPAVLPELFSLRLWPGRENVFGAMEGLRPFAGVRHLRWEQVSQLGDAEVNGFLSRTRATFLHALVTDLFANPATDA
jgi:hypothetical protein